MSISQEKVLENSVAAAESLWMHENRYLDDWLGEVGGEEGEVGEAIGGDPIGTRAPAIHEASEDDGEIGFHVPLHEVLVA